MTKVAAFYVAAKAIEMSISEDFDMLWDELNESNYISFNSGFWLTDWPLTLLCQQVRRGKRLYGEAAAELASNLAELQRGRLPEARLMDKPQKQTSLTSIRLRQEPRLPRATPVGSVIIKNSPLSNCSRGFVQEWTFVQNRAVITFWYYFYLNFGGIYFHNVLSLLLYYYTKNILFYFHVIT